MPHPHPVVKHQKRHFHAAFLLANHIIFYSVCISFCNTIISSFLKYLFRTFPKSFRVYTYTLFSVFPAYFPSVYYSRIWPRYVLCFRTLSKISFFSYISHPVILILWPIPAHFRDNFHSYQPRRAALQKSPAHLVICSTVV